ncbi:MAG: DNA-directed RNA polymerase subunit beta [Bacteroidetes bacterium]|nr:DNA-directed RNA polymerase subunit beta [Bacteroidota bacterium]
MANIFENTRINFGKIPRVAEYPDLLEVQLDSFKTFMQLDTPPDRRTNEGLWRVFQENFPVSDARENFVLEFRDYSLDPPRYSIEECRERGLTYSVALKAKLYLYCTDEDNEDFEPVSQEVYLGNIPYMTPSGTFIINGAERVIVSQLHRSPGVFFGQSMHPNGTRLYSARIIPFKGSWIEFSTDVNNVMYAYIDGKKKFPITTLLRAIGYSSDKEVLELFGLAEEVKATKASLKKVVGRKLAARVLKSWVEDFVDEDTGEVINITRNEVLLERDHVITEDDLDTIENSGEKSVILLSGDSTAAEYSVIINTLQKDNSNSEMEAMQYIYRQLRNAEAPDEETARGIIDKLFFSDKRYDLGEVGRYRLNKKLHGSQDEASQVLTKHDIICIVKYLIELVNSKANVDDIDHLSNRRVRTVGEQLYGQFSVGLARMARTIRERMNIRDNELFTPSDLINARTLSSVINSFFGTSQLSQFMDQTNPLSEITHKRRISALGPGGLSREHAGFEVRDVHYSHYGRLCPIETPEGPNIGLISSLCVYAKVNSMGFIETPYLKVEEGKVDLKKVNYLSAEEEDNATIAQSSTKYIDNGTFSDNRIKARHLADYPVVTPEELDYVDIAPNQIVSVAASLIPFLEHDDANRALMGSNMQRQAVPLLRPDAPVVGTGLELKTAADSRTQLIAEGNGIVVEVDATHVTIRYDRDEIDDLVSFDSNVKTYYLQKFVRTNQSTAVNLRPIVKKGTKVSKGTVLVEGYSTEAGELALGRNLLVAFMPWQGYNFEDAIVISERVVSEDLFTSLHVEEFEMQVRDTKLGQEELTNEIPNVSEEATRNLDENGLIRIGAEVKEGDILIGKITPKGETDPTPEEKLLRAIFGDKAGDVKDASLKAPPSFQGVVIDKKLFSKDRKDGKTRAVDKKKLTDLEEQYKQDITALDKQMTEKLLELVGSEKLNSVKDKYGEEVISAGKKLTAKAANLRFIDVIPSEWTKDEALNSRIVQLFHNYTNRYNEIDGKYKREKYQISVGDELPTGIIKLAKVYVANKRKLKVGDKMAGRHGNKGIVSRIVRQEDMPFLEDGTPVDVVLNPLGVPSRMNLGQIYETILGWAGHKLGVKYATPIFDGATEEEVNQELKKAGLPDFGATYLYDGQSGERFDQPTTVGIIYMLKLSHMVDDKMHARSIGPYSLITQQPLGGKAQFGGQRFGEMEVWALEAFGAAHILRELLTVKSDDVIGRAKTYECIVKGENIPTPGIPESFNVLMHELRGLALEISLD